MLDMRTAAQRETAGETIPLAINPRIAFLAILLVALLLRVWGVNFGLPYIYHPDEAIAVRISQRMFANGDPNPHFFNYPSLMFDINALAYVPYYFVARMLGTLDTPSDLKSPDMLAMAVGKTEMPSTLLLGRGVSELFGLGVVILVFLSVRKLTSSTLTGLMATLLVAVCPQSAGHSRVIAPNIFVAFFALLSFYGSVGVFRTGSRWGYVIAGFAGGLAASSKYNGAVVLGSLLVAHFLRYGPSGIKHARLWLALTLSVLAFFLTTPFALLDSQLFLAHLRFVSEYYSQGQRLVQPDSPTYYPTFLWQVEGVAAVLAAVQVVRGVYTRSRQTLVLASFPLAYLVLITSYALKNDRQVLPMVPFVLMLAALPLADVFRLLYKRYGSDRRMIYACALVLVGVVSWPLYQTIRTDLSLSTPDSRQTSMAWIERNIPAGSKVAVESYSVYVDPARFVVRGKVSMIDHDPEWYVDQGFDYLVFGEKMFRRYYGASDYSPQKIAAYEELFDSFPTVKTFNDGGYEVRIVSVADRNRTD